MSIYRSIHIPFVCIAAALLSLLSACETAKPPSQTAASLTPAAQPQPKRFPNGRSDSEGPYFRQVRIPAAAEDDYGRTPAKPITTGPRDRSIHILFLHSLRGPNGQPVEFERRRSCCEFSDPSLPLGGGLLDEYEIKVDGSKEPILLYINMYGRITPDNLRIPRGFTQR